LAGFGGAAYTARSVSQAHGVTAARFKPRGVREDHAMPDHDLPARARVGRTLHDLKRFEHPWVSLVVPRHAGTDAGVPDALVDESLRTLDLPDDTRRTIKRRVLESLRAVHEAWAVAYASEDGAVVRTVGLKVAPPLPERDAASRVRFGEAWTAPLDSMLAFDRPTLAVWATNTKARLFAVDFGEASELSSFVGDVNRESWRPYSEASTGMPGEPARGGSGMDDVQDRTDDWIRRLNRLLLDEVQDALRPYRQAGFVLLTDDATAARLERHMDAGLKRSYLGAAGAPGTVQVPDDRFLRDVAERTHAAVQASQMQWLETGDGEVVTDLDAILSALDRGQVDTLALATSVSPQGVQDLSNGRVHGSMTQLRRENDTGSPSALVPMSDVWMSRVKDSAARVWLLRGEAERALLQHGPVAARLRRG
jgi:hypothetical protein